MPRRLEAKEKNVGLRGQLSSAQPCRKAPSQVASILWGWMFLPQIVKITDPSKERVSGARKGNSVRGKSRSLGSQR